MLVIVAPGQGSQTPGFLDPWLELDGFRDRLEWLSAAAALDLVGHGTTSDAETIRDTAVAQPLIVAAGLGTLPAVLSETGGTVSGWAGHSVGEITAYAAAQVLSQEQAMILVRERGQLMAEAAAATPTGMSAVLGGDADEVTTVLEQHGLTPANINGGGQIVAAGTMDQLAALQDAPPTRARVIPLQVAGAFHTHHMASAVEQLSSYARVITTHDPTSTLLSNSDGAAVTSGPDALTRLVNQVSNPVRWDLCMETFAELGVTGLIEIPPAGTLTGLAKRGLKGVELLALKTPDDLEAAHRMIREHGSAASRPQEDAQ
ncbi:ACP S-malonyltransferase [Ornithinimicrobium cryptoxanthini]|uniref:[acyl-carrier-protein] S-malonyltransferase n=1 Tax=Ornithinimicrobium cryptoxanthini TaxID=2934161 RepID=A0ABY4YE43_9MICO|nr:ACP S-malonyltransferase [Ornithinimicrobium cryptoxanthini]USQ75056.1 ACP S-malonyltransferase [Ornithinimicrobium cryptoxanthini]